MEPGDFQIFKLMSKDNEDAILRFFDRSKQVDKNLNSDTRDILKQLYQNYNNDGDFDSFILRIQQAIQKGDSTEPIIMKILRSQIATEKQNQNESNCNPLIINVSPPKNEEININSVRNKSVKMCDKATQTTEKFNPLKFIAYKKFKKDYCILEFPSDDNIFDELLYMRNRYSNLKSLAYQIELLNKKSDYRVLEVIYHQ